MEISLHSNQKHTALSYYLSIIQDLINSPKTPFKKLFYADLYCGDGTCEVKRTKEKYEPPIIESILKPAKEGKFPVLCFLNDLDKKKIEDMKEKTKDCKEFIKSYTCEDANKCYTQVLKDIPKDQFCIFFLDPTNHKDLKWNTIKEISEHASIYYGDKIRRPELIINCMTFTMMGSYMAGDYKTINEALGTDEWQKLILDYKENGINAPVERALLDTFVKQLERLGYKVPTPMKVINISPKNTIYFLVWATNERGYEIIEKKVFPYMKKAIEKVQRGNEKKLIMAKEKERGNSFLDKWLKGLL